MKWQVITKFNDKMIEQTTLCDTRGDGSVVEEMSRQVVKMQESGIEEALVEMGWTPPSNKRGEWT